MKDKVVFDVNILVSAVIAPGGAPAQAVRVAIDNHWSIGSSSHIVSKLIEVLSRPRFNRRMGNAELRAFLSTYQRMSTSVVPDPSVTGIADDEEDDRVLGTAVAAGADFVVTGDKGMLAIRVCRGIPIVTARQFLEIVEL